MITEGIVKYSRLGVQNEVVLGNVVEKDGHVVDVKKEVGHYAKVMDNSCIAIFEVKKQQLPNSEYCKLVETVIDFGTEWEHSVEIEI